MKRKLLPVAGASILATSLLVGCSGRNEVLNSTDATKSTSKVTEVTFWHSMGGKGGEAIETLVSEFNSSQSNIKVVAEYKGSTDDSINKLKSAALGNSGPDIMQLYEVGTKWMIDSGYATPMQELIDRDGYDISSLEENILDYYKIDGTLYSMPFNTSTPILYYNKTAFEEVGLDPEVAPTNFDEILEFSKMLKTETRYGYSMRVYGWFFEQFLIKQGLDYANEGNGRDGIATSVVFDENGGAFNIIQGWKNLIDSGYVLNLGRSDDAVLDAFGSGKVAMIIGSTASLTDIKSKVGESFDLGTAYLPSVSSTDEGGVSIGGASLWIMDKGSDVKQEAAFEFIKFMVSAESQAKWAAATGYFSVTKDAYGIESMQEHLEKNPEFLTAINQLRESNNQSGALLGVFPEARASIEENIEKVLNNEIDSQTAVSNIAKTINTALEKYNKANN